MGTNRLATKRKTAVERPGSVVVVGIAVVVALLIAACGSGTTTAAEGGVGSGPGDQPLPAEGAGLALRVIGQIDGQLLCPGGRRPCLPIAGPVEPDSEGSVWLAGRLVDGVFVIDDQMALPGRVNRDYSNRCPDEIAAPPPPEELEGMYEDLAQRPPGYADLWDSDDGVLHLGVSGDTGPAEAFLSDRGMADQICIVSGFPHTDEVLEGAQRAVSDAARAEGFDGYGVGRDIWEGTVTIDLPRFDQDFRAALDEISAANDDMAVQAMASVEVINGSLDDYEAALVDIAVTPDASQQLSASCGSVQFSSIPPNLDEFPPLDDDAQAALDELVNGPTGVEAGGLDTGLEWSIASRTDGGLVLFGQGSNDPGSPENASWVSATFDRLDGAWRPTGWGDCRVEIAALGLGPATVATDPDEPLVPGDTELSLLIQEQNCASGRAPVDREVVLLVTEAEETVTIVALVAPVEGGADCQGNPWHPITVTLDSPLGSRQLVDGHGYPPRPVADAGL